MTFEWTRILILTLAHSIWIGAGVALAQAVIGRIVPSRDANTRYAMGCGAMVFFVVAVVFMGSLVGAVDERVLLNADVADTVASGPPQASIDTPGPAVATAEPTNGARFVLLNTDPRPASSPTVQADTPGPSKSTGWLYPVCVSLWALGVLAMVLRLVFSARRVRREISLSQPLADPQLESLITQMASQLRVTRRFTARVGEHLTPAVTGLFKSVLLLPIHMATQLDESQTRAILAHELMHIRRYDTLVNLLQRIAEAVFFFNPAVWYVSRQIRIERELCCDLTAATFSHDVPSYVQTLQQLATASFPNSAVAFSHKGSPNTLLIRARRLLGKEHATGGLIRWPAFLGLGALTVVAVCLLSLALRSPAEALAEAMTPEQRVEKIKSISETFDRTHPGNRLGPGPIRRPKGDEGMLRGVVVDADGTPIEDAIIVVDQPGMGWDMRIGKEDKGEFAVKVNYEGKVSLAVVPNGRGDVATCYFGPYTVAAGQTLDGLRLELPKGQGVELHVLDPSGVPLSGAKIMMWVTLGGNSRGYPVGETDAQGKVIVSGVNPEICVLEIQHPTLLNCRFALDVPGNQPKLGFAERLSDRKVGPDRATVSSDGNRITVRMTKRPVLLRGKVVDGKGHPLAHGKLYLYGGKNWTSMTKIPAPSKESPGKIDPACRQKPTAVTDEQGRFCIYANDAIMLKNFTAKGEHMRLLLVSDQSGVSRLFPPVTYEKPVTLLFAPQTETLMLEGDIGPLFESSDEVTLNVRMGRLDRVYPVVFRKAGTDDGVPVYDPHALASFPSFVGLSLSVELPDLLGGWQPFNIGRSFSGEVPKMHCRIVKKDPLYGLKKGKRTVVFLLESPKGSPAAEGTLCVRVGGKRGWAGEARVVAIKNGRGRLELETPTQLELLGCDGWDVSGYLPKSMSCPTLDVSEVKPKAWRQKKLTVTTGDKALEVQLPLEPAGLIRGTLKTSKGTLAHDWIKSDLVRRYGDDGMKYLAVDKKTATYLLRNVRLNTPMVVEIPIRGATPGLESKPITLTAENPIQTVDLTYPPGTRKDPKP